ncbi:MAG: hypothetical protein QXW60_03565 [Nitrososphaerota archaeon]
MRQATWMGEMPSKITLGLILSSLGMIVSLASPIIHIFLVSIEVKSILGHELMAGFPLHLLLSILGVPIAITGLFLFRRGVREELTLESEVSLRHETVLERLERRGLITLNEGEASQERSSETGSKAAPTPTSRIKVKSSGISIICPKCGNETRLGEDKCRSCGERFKKSSEPIRACPICGGDLLDAQKLEDNMYVCGLCFSELEIDAETARRIFE